VALLYAVIGDKMVVHQTKNDPKEGETIERKKISVYKKVNKISCKKE
jgi:hypothetical protein